MDAPVLADRAQTPKVTPKAAVAEALLSIAGYIRLVADAGTYVEVGIYREIGHISLRIHGLPDYVTGVSLMRSFSIKSWNKRSFGDADSPSCVLEADLGENVGVILYCKGLTPTCKLVKRIERIPKSQTVETGELIEVERTVIECGKGEAA
jgi:hypothetical protein